MDKSILTNSWGEVVAIRDQEDLLARLRAMQKENPQIGILSIPGLGILTFGISQSLGFVEYIAENQEPPYLLANTKQQEHIDGFFEFDSGGTATPIPIDQCIPIDLVLEILVNSFARRKLPNLINWYEE